MTHIFSIEFNESLDYHVEMRRKKLSSHSIYLNCTSSKCNAKLILIVKPEDKNCLSNQFGAKGKLAGSTLLNLL